MLAGRIAAALSEPWRVGHHELITTASIGIAAFDRRPTSPQDLLRDADTAMYRAKELGKDGYAVFTSELRTRTLERSRAEQALRSALADNRVTVHYQPIVDLGSGRILGVEALARLRRPDGTLAYPDSFIAVAEETGLIVPLGEQVLRIAAAQVAAWSRGRSPLRLAVNVAARQAAQLEFVGVLLGIVQESGLPPEALEVELTESALLEATAGTLDSLHLLRGSGIGVGIDDFGTGYASMRYLRQFPVSFVKVDRSFTAGIDGDPRDRSIVAAISRLALDLDIACVAEGIETEAQREQLVALGVPYGQGYLLGRPAPAEEIGALLTAGRVVTRAAAGVPAS